MIFATISVLRCDEVTISVGRALDKHLTSRRKSKADENTLKLARIYKYIKLFILTQALYHGFWPITSMTLTRNRNDLSTGPYSGTLPQTVALFSSLTHIQSMRDAIGY